MQDTPVSPTRRQTGTTSHTGQQSPLGEVSQQARPDRVRTTSHQAPPGSQNRSQTGTTSHVGHRGHLEHTAHPGQQSNGNSVPYRPTGQPVTYGPSRPAGSESDGDSVPHRPTGPTENGIGGGERNTDNYAGVRNAASPGISSMYVCMYMFFDGRAGRF